MKEKEFKIRFVPTNNVFTLPEADIDEILKNDRGNYQVLDKNYKYKKTMTKIPELTVLEQVLDNDQNDNPIDEVIVAGDAGVFDENGEKVTPLDDTDNEDVIPSDNEKDEQPDERLQELKGTKKDDLIKYCAENNIEIATNAKKDEIINAILEFETEE
jgi:hypothetical protein